eukprot:scaffold4825_cov132-Cylindrotheca_fusiformis.AAC.8
MSTELQRKVGEVGTEKWGVDNVDSRFAQRIAPHDTHDDVSSLARDERELSNGHAGGDAATVAHFSCGPTTADGTRDCFSPEPISHHNKPRSTTSRKEQDDRQRAAPVGYLR